MFNIRTLLFFILLVLIVLLIEMIVLRRVFPRQKYFTFFVWSYAAGTLGTLGLVLRDFLPDFVSIVLANALVGTGYYLVICAMESLIGRNQYRVRWYGPAILIYAAVFYYFGVIEPSYSQRVIISGSFYGLLSFTAGWILLRSENVTVPAGKWLGIFFILNGIRIVLRMVPGNIALDQESLLSFTTSAQVMIIMALIFMIVLGSLIVLLALQIDRAEQKADMWAEN